LTSTFTCDLTLGERIKRRATINVKITECFIIIKI
jgi:hypothetical protein